MEKKQCPKCQSERVAKEIILGSKTGDWKCGKCGETGSKERFLAKSEKSHD